MKLRELLIIIGCIAFNSCMTDLRTAYNEKEGYDEALQTKGRHVLTSALKKVGMEKLTAYDLYTVNFSDEFMGLSGAYANPYKNKLNEFELNYVPKTFNGNMTFLNGKEKGKHFGLMNGETFEVIDGYRTKGDSQDKRTNFWLPTYQYFIEFPLRILEADKICYAGSRTENGRTYDLVLATWKTFKPQKKMDQYLVWVSQTTGRIEILEYTIRDYYSFIKGKTYYEDYKTFNGIEFATSMRVVSTLNDSKLMHHMKIDSVKFKD